MCVTRWWAGRDNAILTEPTLSHANSPKTRKLPSPAPAYFAAVRHTSRSIAALDLTTSHGIGNGAVSLTVAGGSSVGEVPPQRYWFLGGSRTVRGHRPGTEAGDAFWLARAEIAHGLGVVRPVLFGDIGWAGDRHDWRSPGRPISGAGVGASVLDGLIRFDLSRGIHPDRGWRADMYLQGTF